MSWHAPSSPPQRGNQTRTSGRSNRQLSQCLSMVLTSKNSAHFPQLLSPYLPFPLKITQKTKLISPLLNLPHMIFDLPLLTKSTGKKLSSVKLSKGTKAARPIYFPLHSFSSGLKVSAESRAEQVWLGDDLHLHRISAAPPGGVGRMTLFGCTCTQWLRAKPFMLIHWVNESCEVVLIRSV